MRGIRRDAAIFVILLPGEGDTKCGLYQRWSCCSSIVGCPALWQLVSGTYGPRGGVETHDAPTRTGTLL